MLTEVYSDLVHKIYIQGSILTPAQTCYSVACSLEQRECILGFQSSRQINHY